MVRVGIYGVFFLHFLFSKDPDGVKDVLSAVSGRMFTFVADLIWQHGLLITWHSLICPLWWVLCTNTSLYH